MKLYIAGIAAALLAVVGAAEDVANAPPPKDTIKVDLVTLNGSGCPPGSATVAVAPDNTAFTVTYSSYMAAAGYGTKPTDSRRNCQLAVQLQIPQGFTYAIAKADYRGFASLADGATASQRASYYFQGMSETTRTTHLFNGPMDDNWQITDVADVAAIVYHPCGAKRNLNLNTEIRVNKGTSDPYSTSYVAVDSTDASFSTIYHFQWKHC